MESNLVVHAFTPVLPKQLGGVDGSRNGHSVFLCPLTLELSFYKTVFHVPFSLVGEGHPYVTSLGQLPCGVERDTVHVKDQLLKRVCQLSFRGFPDPPTRLLQSDLPPDERRYVTENVVLQELATAQLGVINHLLWCNDKIYRKYTRPIMMASMPTILAVFFCWRIRQNIQEYCGSFSDEDVVIRRLQLTLQACSKRLQQNGQFYGESRPNYVDARVFSWLAVIFSIPLQDTPFGDAVAAHQDLIDYCARVNQKYEIWNGPTFLSGVSQKSTDFESENKRKECNGPPKYNMILWAAATSLGAYVYYTHWMKAADPDPFILHY